MHNEKRTQILIVDDDETFCRCLAELLEYKSIEVTWTTDGLKGYDSACRQAYDLYIFDVRMPLVSGIELSEGVKEIHHDAKIILISAFADNRLRQTADTLGVTVLSKPFNANRLLELVETTLRAAA